MSPEQFGVAVTLAALAVFACFALTRREIRRARQAEADAAKRVKAMEEDWKGLFRSLKVALNGNQIWMQHGTLREEAPDATAILRRHGAPECTPLSRKD